MRLKKAYYLGLTGSIGGILTVGLAMLPIVKVIDMKQYSHAMGVSGICFSLMALFGCFLIKRNREILACFLLLISAVGGIISMSLYYVVPGFLLIAAGILTIMSDNEPAQDTD